MAFLPSLKSLYRLAAAMAACLAACSTGGLEEPHWLPAALNTAPNASFTVSKDDTAALHTLHALGFARLDMGRYRRQVDLLEHGTLVPSAMQALPEIDAIAIISIHRPFLGDKQYIYDTLRSLNAELPNDAQINILVGNADVGYLSRDILAREAGADLADRVHITAAPEPVSHFFNDELISTGPRAAWNYARALRSYSGSKHLLLLEDDISLSKNSISQLRPFLAAAPVSVLALFNDRCASIGPTYFHKGSALSVGGKQVLRNSDFPTLQAMVFSADVANDAGEYLVTRAGRESHDYMLGRFFGQTRSILGYVQPSIAQHEGRRTTGLSGPNSVPYSTCYVDDVLAETQGSQQ